MGKTSQSNSWNRAVRQQPRRNGAEQFGRPGRFLAYLLPLAAGLSGTFASEALAQPSADSDQAGGLQEIVVTAQKRVTSLQKTPISVTAVSGEELRSAQITTLPDITARVPSFKMGDQGGNQQITIRGIGISNFTPMADGAVAVNIDEVYVSRPVSQGLSLYDISAIEVLRGPQGTLYGRNATAGAVNITTVRPTNEFSGFVRATVGNYGLAHLEGAVGGPIVEDKLLVRLAGFREKRNGYSKNIITGNDADDKDAWGVRGTIVFKPTEELTATIIGAIGRSNDRSGSLSFVGAAGLIDHPAALGIPPVFQLLGGATPSDRRDLAAAVDPRTKLRTDAITGILEWDSDGPFSLKSITGYRDQNTLSRIDISGGGLNGGISYGGEPAHQFSQELQAHYDTERVNLTAGLYYFRETSEYDPATIIVSNTYLNLFLPHLPFFQPPFPPAPVLPTPGFTRLTDIGGKTKTRAKAAFAEGTVNVTDQLSVTAGIRYSRERKQLTQRNFLVNPFNPLVSAFTGSLISPDFDPPPEVAIPGKTFSAWTPRFGIQFQATPSTLLYVTYAKGFKSGGFDAGTAPALQVGFAPEKLTDYEGGIKTTLFDRRLRLNVSGFLYDYTDLQVQVVQGLSIITTNADSARVYGAELEFTALVTDAFTIEGNASWLHARYRNYFGTDPALPNAVAFFDFKGNRLSNAPDFQAFLAASYRWDLPSGNLVLRAEGEYSSKFYFSPANLDLISQPSYGKANAFVTYNSNAGWHATAFVRNITNKDTLTSMTTVSPLFGTPVQGSFSPPRTFGATLGYRF